MSEIDFVTIEDGYLVIRLKGSIQFPICGKRTKAGCRGSGWEKCGNEDCGITDEQIKRCDEHNKNLDSPHRVKLCDSQ